MWNSPNYVSYLDSRLSYPLYLHLCVCVSGARRGAVLFCLCFVQLSSTSSPMRWRNFLLFIPFLFHSSFLASLNLICIFSTMHVIIRWYLLPVPPFLYLYLNLQPPRLRCVVVCCACDFIWFWLVRLAFCVECVSRVRWGSNSPGLWFDYRCLCAFHVRRDRERARETERRANTAATTFNKITLLH